MRSLLFPPFVQGRGAFGILLLRAIVGAAFVLHGWGKVQNPMGPMAWMDQPDKPSPIPGIFQALAAFSEVGGGALLILGLLTPFAALALAGVMVGALAIVHLPAGHAFVPSKPGEPSFELAAVYLTVMATILCLGPGAYSVDAGLFGPQPADPPKQT